MATYYRKLGTIQDIYRLLDVDDSTGLLAPRPRAAAIVNVRSSIILRMVKRFPNELKALCPRRRCSSALTSLARRESECLRLGRRLLPDQERKDWLDAMNTKIRKDAPVLLCLMKPGNKDYKSLYLFPNLDLQRAEFGGRFLQNGHKVTDIAELCLRIRSLVATCPSRDPANSPREPLNNHLI